MGKLNPKDFEPTVRNVRLTARQVRKDMTAIHSGKLKLAESMGRLMALLDNADEAESLASSRSEEAWAHFRALDQAYDRLAGFLQGANPDAKPDQ